MSKKRLLVLGLLLSWGAVKANTPGGCEQCCVLEGRCLVQPKEAPFNFQTLEIDGFAVTEADFPQNLLRDAGESR